MCHTKFKGDNKNRLNVLAIDDGDDCKFGKYNCSKKRKNKKINSDIIRSIETGTCSILLGTFCH